MGYDIKMQTIQVIDYEGNNIKKREVPESFSEYVTKLVDFLCEHKSVREFKTRSNRTEVISCILSVIENQENESVMIECDKIANRLLQCEVETQSKVAQMDIRVQKGSLIQALIYDEEVDKYSYLLAKVQHSDFVDDYDFSFKSGFSKNTKEVWKTCIFDIENLTADVYMAKVYMSHKSNYWWDNFLELKEAKNDEINTTRAFEAIDNCLGRNIRNASPRDYTILRNATITYFKGKDYIDYDEFCNSTFSGYDPVDINKTHMEKFLAKLKELPEKKDFDRQFNLVSSVINAKIRKTYNVYMGIELRITDKIDNIEDVIIAKREDDGNKYIQIRTDNDVVFRSFSK